MSRVQPRGVRVRGMAPKRATALRATAFFSTLLELSDPSGRDRLASDVDRAVRQVVIVVQLELFVPLKECESIVVAAWPCNRCMHTRARTTLRDLCACATPSCAA